MQPLGTLLLHLAFILTGATGIVAVAAGVLRDERLMRGARYGMYASVCLYFAMAGVLWHGYFTHDFASKYIATYSDRGMPAIYLFTSFWGGEKGALMFWALVLTVFSTVAVHQARDRDITYLGYATGILCGAIFFYDVLMVFEANPFETFRTFDGPLDGDGLNPLLQNPTMAIHPPSLLTGYIAFTIPFAFGASSLFTGRLDDQWARDTRKWTLVSWLFLTVGLVLGGAWAYQELGWGGFWMWDPVENAGLIPWFTATAFLHSIIVQERYQMLRRWNFTLVCLTFFLTVFGTFLTRSQLIVSIHAFADSKVAVYFIYYMVSIAIVSLVLLAWRWRAMKAPTRIESFLSRESFFVLNNVLLLLCAFIVLWGTLYSKISAAPAFRGGYNWVAETLTSIGIPVDSIFSQQELGEPWFNRVMVPSGVALLALTAIGPLIAWRRTTKKALAKTFMLPFVLATGPVFLGAVGWILWKSHTIGVTLEGSLSDGYALWVETVQMADVYAFLTIWFASFIFTGVGVEYWKGGRVRQKKRGGTMVGSMWVLALRSKRRYIGYVVHVGMALAFLGFAGAAFKQTTPETALHAGEDLKVGSYTATFAAQHDRFQEGQGYVAQQVDVLLQEPGETVPAAEVKRITAYLDSRQVGQYFLETKPNSPKVRVRFASAEAADRVREELYVGTVMKERFQMLPARSGAGLTLRFGFADKRLIETFPPVIHQHVDDARRTLASIRTSPSEVVASMGQPEFSIKFPSPAGMARFQALWRADAPPLEGLLMARADPVDDALEIITDRTGHILRPEVRRYVKHASPTTEVAIWSRAHEDVYFAMRPTMGGSFVSLLSFVNPMINLLWLGTVIMFLGGVLLLMPTDWLLARLPESASNDPDAAPPRRAAPGVVASILVLLVGGGILLASRSARAETPAQALLGAVRCVCEDAGERVIDQQKTLLDCTCPLGLGLRRSAETALANATPEALAAHTPQLSFLQGLVDQDPGNERLLIYNEGTHKDLMTNTWCTCGCGKMALAQCPLDCPWSPHFKSVFKVLLAAGLTREESRTFYLGVINKEHRKADDPLFTLDQIWMNRTSSVSWGIPVTAGVLVAVVISSVIMLRARRAAPAPAAATTAGADQFRDDLDDLGV